MSKEEKKALEQLNKRYGFFKENPLATNVWLSLDVYNLGTILNLIEKQQKEIEELKREKETNQQMIHLAETQILGYGQGYKDGLNKETTVTEIVARERENQIIYEEMKHKINMEWVFKIKAKIEELKLECENCPYQGELCDELNSNNNCVPGMSILILQSLLEKE